jgi:hypothetical protein
VHQYETSLLQNDLWRDLSGEGQKGVKVSAVSEKIRKLAGRGSRRAGKGKGPKAGRGRARNFTDGLRDEMEDAGTAGAKRCVRDEMHGKNVECCGISRHREHAIE